MIVFAGYIDVVDEVSYQIMPLSKRAKSDWSSEVEAVVASIARVPVKRVSQQDKEALKIWSAT